MDAGVFVHTIFGEPKAVSLAFNPWQHDKIEFQTPVGEYYHLYIVSVDRYGNSIRQRDPFDWIEIESSVPFLDESRYIIEIWPELGWRVTLLLEQAGEYQFKFRLTQRVELDSVDPKNDPLSLLRGFKV